MTFKLAFPVACGCLVVAPTRKIHRTHERYTHCIEGCGEGLCTLSTGAEYAAFSSHFELIFGTPPLPLSIDHPATPGKLSTQLQ